MKNRRGFTLIELIIVIAILAILSTLGFIQYHGINSRARDSARKADIYEMATALEVNKTQESYTPLASNQFSSFQWVDPSGDVYCIGVGSPADPLISAPWGNSCPSGFAPVAPGIPGGIFTAWKLCSYLENPLSGSNVFCRISAQ